MEASLPVILFQSSLSLTWIEGARREGLLLKQNSETKNELVRCWMARSKERSLVAPIFEEINTVKDNFISFSLVFQGREGNKVAHAYARLACASNVTQEWLGVCPEFLLDSILADCNSMILS
jgi:hypothetical protein